MELLAPAEGPAPLLILLVVLTLFTAAKTLQCSPWCGQLMVVRVRGTGSSSWRSRVRHRERCLLSGTRCGAFALDSPCMGSWCECLYHPGLGPYGSGRTNPGQRLVPRINAGKHPRYAVLLLVKSSVGRALRCQSEEISTISNGVEPECFGHGALLAAIRASAHMSSMRGDHSVTVEPVLSRAACRMSCSILSTVVSMGGIDRLLCPKLCTIDDDLTSIRRWQAHLRSRVHKKAPGTYSDSVLYRRCCRGRGQPGDVARRHRFLNARLIVV